MILRFNLLLILQCGFWAKFAVDATSLNMVISKDSVPRWNTKEIKMEIGMHMSTTKELAWHTKASFGKTRLMNYWVLQHFRFKFNPC